MRAPYEVPIWKKAPIIRLLLPLTAGIIIAWYLQPMLFFILLLLFSFTAAFLLFNLLPTAMAFRFKGFRGFVFHLLIIAFGMLITWQKDLRNRPHWYGHFTTDSSVLQLKIAQPVTVKNRSVKVEGEVLLVVNDGTSYATEGKILLYLAPDSGSSALRYGDVIVISKPLHLIKNAGNPGGFNYKRYAAFQQLYHQVYLKQEDWQLAEVRKVNFFRAWLFSTKAYVLSVLSRYISNKSGELGIAEALLIGYKDDLDKDLVQAYTNTGVVHIIAISGLHLGLIYAVLLWIFNRTPGLKKSRHTKAMLLISCLWIFALLTGGSASVLRSAVMFTVIVTGKYYFKQSSVYNSLSTSAFILLCYNPYLLWDVGFQLSYCAVIGIVAFQQFLFRKWYFKNWLTRQLWSMITVTIAAQLAAFPLCLYYFHQFPNLFLFTNILTVPLSTLLLFGEILLVLISPVEAIAHQVGLLVSKGLQVMNSIILYFDQLPFSVSDNIYADIFTTWLLYGIVIGFMAFWMKKKQRLLQWSLAAALVFSGLHVWQFFLVKKQKAIVIYNVSRHKAVDFIEADRFCFVGDSTLQQPGIQQNFHLKPARVAMQATTAVRLLGELQQQNGYYEFGSTRLLMLDSASQLTMVDTVRKIDVLLLSHNPDVDIEQALSAVRPDCIVFDASNSLWKIQKWKSACEELNLRFHSVPEQGAFILNTK